MALPPIILSLGFTDAEYLGSAVWALPLSGRALILHNNRPGVSDFNLLPALHTIRLHFDLLIRKVLGKRVSHRQALVNRFCRDYIEILQNFKYEVAAITPLPSPQAHQGRNQYLR